MNREAKMEILKHQIIEYLEYRKNEKKQKITVDLICNLLKEEVLTIRDKRHIRDQVVTGYWGQVPLYGTRRELLQGHPNMNALNIENMYSKFSQSIYNNWGFGAMSYFKFIKFIMKLNLMVFVVSFIFLGSVPIIGAGRSHNITRRTCLKRFCPDYVPKPTTNIISVLVAIFSGEGFVESSFLFYSSYRFPSYIIPVLNKTYNMRMGYPLVMLCCYSISLVYLGVMLSKNSKNAAIFKNIRSPDIGFTQLVYTPVVSANSQTVGRLYKRRLQMELISRQNEAEDNSKKTTFCVIIARILINLITLFLVAGSGMLMYYANNLALRNKDTYLMQYLPTLLFVIFDFLFPIILDVFQYIEKYKGNYAILSVLIRLVSLRLVPLCVYCFLVFTTTIDKDPCCQCWESQVGKALYKILFSVMIFDLLSILVITPIKIMVTKKYPEFSLMDNILQLIKMQLLQWILMLLIPMISMITLIFQIFLLMLKYIELKYLRSQSKIPLNYIPSEMFFTGVLLIIFNLKCFVSLYLFINVPTSVSCGPFRTFTFYGAMMEKKIKIIPEMAYKLLLSESTGIAMGLVFISAIIMLSCKLKILQFDYDSIKMHNKIRKKLERETNEIRIKHFNKSKKYKDIINDMDNLGEESENL